jgi:hypothetical protein
MSEMPAGKKLIKKERIIISVFTVFCVILILLNKEGSDLIVAVVALLLSVILVQILITPGMKLFVKLNVTSLTKTQGKMPYTEHSVIEFYDDIFVETSEDNKTEMKYSAIENVFVNDKLVAIFINKMQAYIIPVVSFKSNEEMLSLVRFISEKRQGV